MSVIINDTPYFLGPLYTNNIYSYTNISIINDSNYVGIITGNISCTNISINDIVTTDISSTNTTITLASPINYTTNFSNAISVAYHGLGITTINNISNTLGYLSRITTDVNVNASFPIFASNLYPLAKGTNYTFNSTTPTEIASMIMKEPGIYLLYIQFPLWVLNPSNTNYTLHNLYSEIKANDTLLFAYSEESAIVFYQPSSTLFSNLAYIYSKTLMCNITEQNTKLRLFIILSIQNQFYTIITDPEPFGYKISFQYSAIKIT